MRAAAATRPRLPTGPSLTRAGLVLGGGGVLLLAVLLAAVAIGSVGVGIGETAAILGRRLLGLPPAETW